MFLIDQYQNSISEQNDWVDRLINQSNESCKNRVKNKNVNKIEKPLETKLNKPACLNLEKSVGSRFLAQDIDSTALQKNARLTEWVRLRFFQSTVKPIACIINSRPTDLSRIKHRFAAIPSGLPLYDKLSIIQHKKTLYEFEFKQSHSEIIIGHHPLANIVLDGPKVSSFHCKISCQNGRYFLQDLDSQYGTYLNGKKIISKFSVELNNAALIRIMGFQIRLEIINSPPTTVSKTQNKLTHTQQQKTNYSIEHSHKNPTNFSITKDLLKTNKTTNQGITELIVTEIRNENDCVKTFRLVATSACELSYLPGQFITLLLTINGKPVQRCYSISSSPSRPQTLDITVKRVPGGLVSNWLCDKIKLGDTLKMKSFRGNFSQLLKPSKKLLFIGAGSGVVPLMSMLRWQFDTGSSIETKAIFSFKGPKEILFNKEIEWINDVSNEINIAITLTKCNKRTANHWNGLFGRVDLSLLTSFITALHQTDVYLCGPEEFMSKVKEILKSLNFPTEQIHSESFTHSEKKTPSLPPQLKETSTIKDKSLNNKNKQKKTALHQVTFTKSNRIIQVDENTTLLEVAEKENLDIEFSCRAGFCAECMVKCTSGKVRMEDKCEIDTHEREQGWIFSCCSYAQSDLVIDA